MILWLIPIGLALVVAHDLSVRIWPWKKCRACRGRKTFDSPTGRAYRKCTTCVGRGEQRRRPLVVGRR